MNLLPRLRSLSEIWKFKGIQVPSSENDRDDATEGKNGDTVSNVAPMSTLASEEDAVAWVCSRIQAWWRWW